MTSTDCDTNLLVRSWSGERYDTLTLPLTTSITIGYTSSAWFGPNLYPAAGGTWAVMNRINLAVRPDGYINSSPVTNTLPVLFKPVGQQLTHIVQMSDNDGTDILKCRWSNSNSGTNYNRKDECVNACAGLNGISTLYEENCTLVFTLPTTRIGWYYVIALQIEDYYDSSSPAPMSSVPIQFLFYAYSSSSSCTTRPQIIGERPNRACIGTPINVTLTERVIAQSFCSGTTISNYVTSSPIGMQHSTVVSQGGGLYVMTLTWTPTDNQYGPQACIGTPINVTLTERVIAQSFCSGATISNYVTSSPIGMRHSTVVSQGGGLYVMTLTWTPTDNQYGPQGFCAGAVDSSNLQSDAWCITYLVGFDSPNLIRATVVQGTASPIGTIFSNHSIFSIQATRDVHRPTRNGTYVKFMDATTNTSVQTFDAGWQSNILYTGNTIIIITNYTWIPGRRYYVLFDSGPESAPITDSTFWAFNIWDPGVSSTTTTTTTPPTTGTVTTRPLSTTTVNTLLTTTGVHVTSTNVIITTTTESTTTSTTTSSNI
ncbi:unnamed protein product [Rotaria sordida]|uniref:Uncharacterized protein n=1 Tax=Rotaria sordida TaxID=392033 RepID=A0A815B1F2_9BILA|nr:unnamed protein product [Rotaria sordida]